MATLEIRITDHAVERFQERVRPGLSVDVAAHELARLIPLGFIYEQPPAWCAARPCPAYLVVGDLVLPLVTCADEGVYYATTCLTRGSRSRFRQHGQRCSEYVGQA